VYDTDTAQAYVGNRKAVSSAAVASQTLEVTGVPFDVTRGCFVELNSAAGDTLEVVVVIDRAPNWFSEGNMKRFASRRNLSG
jgi:hypothetical protein